LEESDSKYCRNDNIMHPDGRQASPFWKGVMLEAQAIKHDYRWVVGDGKKNHFWKIHGLALPPLLCNFGTCITSVIKNQRSCLRFR
jgi:hypothetical protein